VLVERLAKNLNDLLSLIKVGSTHQVDDDGVCAANALAERLGLTLTVDDLNLLVRGRNGRGILLDEGTRELVGFLTVTYSLMIVTHFLEESVSNETVDAGDENTLTSLLGLLLDAGARS